METLGEVYKYERRPVDTRVDRLEDRIAQQEANLNRANDSDYTDSFAVKSNDWTQLEESSMPENEVKELVAEDFRKCIGMIVNDTQTDNYVEVVQIVDTVVAIKPTPCKEPTLISPKYLKKFIM